MRFDYDLVIIGGSAVAAYAAVAASRFNARVALVEAGSSELHQSSMLHHYSLTQLGQVLQQVGKAQQWGLLAGETETTITWQALLERTQVTAQAIATHEQIAESRLQLAAAGVDVISGQGHFSPDRRLGKAEPYDSLPVLEVNGRLLRSRRFLLAPPTQTIVPPVAGLATVNYCTLDSLWETSWASLPPRLLIWGEDPRGIEIAQILNRLGSQVTLVTGGTRLLPLEDAEATHWLQAQLEAEGITLLTNASITQVKQLAGQIWIQAGDYALETDALLLATPHHLSLNALSLETVGVEWHLRGVCVNRKLQTTNSHIYACGEAIGGYFLPHLARYEAEIAVRNALFAPIKAVDYRSVAWALLTQPNLARVGLTEAQARRAYSNDIIVLKHFFKAFLKPQVQDETTGFCKLIVRHSGEILGAHIIGAEASEWIGAIALAIQHAIKLQTIESAAWISPSFSEIIGYLAQQWQWQRRPHWQQSLMESWFNLRR
ncbi:MAG: FAD-dependent oxidoreductase [Elainellaceae cyanobacterium]